MFSDLVLTVGENLFTSLAILLVFLLVTQVGQSINSEIEPFDHR